MSLKHHVLVNKPGDLPVIQLINNIVPAHALPIVLPRLGM